MASDFESLSAINLNNLTALWKAMGAQQQSSVSEYDKFYRCSNWPHRFWSERLLLQSEAPQLAETLAQQSGVIVPIWNCRQYDNTLLEPLLQQQGFSVLFSQTAMMFDLTNAVEENNHDQQMQKVTES